MTLALTATQGTKWCVWDAASGSVRVRTGDKGQRVLASGAGRVVVTARQGALGTRTVGASTVSPSVSTLALLPPAPSQSTIAPDGGKPLAAIAMCAIARRGGVDDEHTRHRPRQSARTDAPCHTRTATPPGRPTNPHWMAAPVGRAFEHEHENGDEYMTCLLAKVFGALVHGRARGVRVPGVRESGVGIVMGALRRGALVPAPSISAPLPTSLPSLISTPPPIPSRSTHASPVATNASSDHVGSKSWDAHVALPTTSVYVSAEPVASGNPDTHTSASEFLRPYAVAAYSLLVAVGLITANGARRCAGVNVNVEGSIRIMTPPAPTFLLAAAPPPILIRASGNWSAGVHDSAIGSNEINAWRTTARAALLPALVMLLDATWTTLKRPRSGPRTPDTVGNVTRVAACTPGSAPRRAAR